MTTFYLYDDARARQFQPFALTRPVGELRVGARLVRERWGTVLGGQCAGFVSAPVLHDFDEAGAPAAVRESIPAGAYLVNARCAPVLARGSEADVVHCHGRVAAVRLTRDVDVAELEGGTLEIDAFVARGATNDSHDGWWLDEVWDLLRDLEPRLRDDLERLTAGGLQVTPDQCRVLGNAGVHAAPDAVIEPFATFDCTGGPIVIEAGATVQSFTRIQGPTWIGPHAIVGSDKVTVCAIGDACKVHGEVSNSVLTGYSNKAHDGFVGHSYLGRWVNLGANTVTSNLKNTYGSVALWTPSGIRDTGLQFLGTLFGDHAKTGIGLTLTTGSVIGAGAQIHGAQTPPKVVPPFAWGEAVPFDTYDIDRFLVVAERVMARRHTELTARQRAQLAAAFAERWSGDG